MSGTVLTLAQLYASFSDPAPDKITNVSMLNFVATVSSWVGNVTAILPLDADVVTTGGNAVTTLLAGHATGGGYIVNPATATVNLGINQIGTASGTTTFGNTIFIAPGQTFTLTPSPNAVSVISSDSNHAFGGYGFQM